MRKVSKTATLVLILFFCITSSANALVVMPEWEGPTTNTDGTPLTDLAGYKIYWGTVSGGPYPNSMIATRCLACASPGLVITDYECMALQPGITYYFVVVAFNTDGVESDPSNEIFITVSLGPVLLGNVDTISPGSAYRVDGYDLTALLRNIGVGVVGSACTPESYNAWTSSGMDVFDLGYIGHISGIAIGLINANFGRTQ